MATVKSRVEALEKDANGGDPDRYVVVNDFEPGEYEPLPPGVLAARVADAQRKAGPGARVYVAVIDGEE
jgi:hypothetical protein